MQLKKNIPNENIFINLPALSWFVNSEQMLNIIKLGMVEVVSFMQMESYCQLLSLAHERGCMYYTTLSAFDKCNLILIEFCITLVKLCSVAYFWEF